MAIQFPSGNVNWSQVGSQVKTALAHTAATLLVTPMAAKGGWLAVTNQIPAAVQNHKEMVKTEGWLARKLGADE